jgi:hypothetical protein
LKYIINAIGNWGEREGGRLPTGATEFIEFIHMRIYRGNGKNSGEMAVSKKKMGFLID